MPWIDGLNGWHGLPTILRARKHKAAYGAAYDVR